MSACLTLGVLIYIGYHVFDSFSDGPELLDASYTTVTESVMTDAYIMRDETPMYAASHSAGSVVSGVSNGGKFPANVKIVSVYSDTSPDTENRLEEIDKQITILEKNKSQDHSVQSTTNIENAIYDTVFLIRSLCEDGRYADALSLRTEMLVNIKKVEILTGEITAYDAQIATLRSEKANLQSKLGELLETVYSDKGGYYFTGNDGYSGIFSSEKVDTLTYTDFAAMISAPPEESERLCIGTLVGGYAWYIACLVDNADAADIGGMKECAVDFTYSNVTLSMMVYRVIAQPGGEQSVVILKCEKMPSGFDYTRMQPAELHTVEYTGFEVPVSALRVVDGYEGVFVKDEVTIRFRRINIIYEKDGYVICTGNPTGEPVGDDEYKWIEQNDIIVVSGRDLYVGKVIG